MEVQPIHAEEEKEMTQMPKSAFLLSLNDAARKLKKDVLLNVPEAARKAKLFPEHSKPEASNAIHDAIEWASGRLGKFDTYFLMYAAERAWEYYCELVRYQKSVKNAAQRMSDE